MTKQPDDCFEVALTPDQDRDGHLSKRLVDHLTPEQIEKGAWTIKTRTIDARHKKVRIRYQIQRSLEVSNIRTEIEQQLHFPSPSKSASPVVIIGAGPAGLFCAWHLLKKGYLVTVIDRGGDVRGRRPALAELNRNGKLDEDNNYCFGEGGAGTFSDGKLYTRSTKRGPIRDVLEVFVAAGAPERILIDARPHIGTNRLPKVIESMRQAMIHAGAKFRFHTKLVDLERTSKGVKLVLSTGEIIEAPVVVLATGHSANDTYQLLMKRSVSVVPKSFAMGVRIEHPQQLIDEIQYGPHAGHESLGAAAYQLRRTVDGVGTFSFCMCPGGFMVASSTVSESVVVNGMSPSKRNSPYANSGMVVSIDSSRFGADAAAALAYQQTLEQRAFAVGGGRYRAPAQRLTDFMSKKISQSLPECSYRPGLTSCSLDDVLYPNIASHLRKGIEFFDAQKLKGYITDEAVVVGVESRSSAAVRIPRQKDSLMCEGFEGLIPCGEGAGYAGGIMSAALDGIRCADAAVRFLSKN